MSSSSRNVLDYLSKTKLDPSQYRVVLDLVGGSDGIDFNLDNDTSLLKGASHLVGVSHAAKFEIHGALGVADTIIFANLTTDAVFTILHDIALDIYFFHHFFDQHLGEKPSVQALKDFSACKVLFARERALSFYGKPITDFKNGDKLNYISFAASCRKKMSLESDLDAGRYNELWVAFLSAFFHADSFNGVRARQTETPEILADRLASYICSAPMIGGQLSHRKLKKEIRRLILLQGKEPNHGRNRDSIFFVATTVSPKAGKKCCAVADLFNSNKWRRNRWRLVINPQLDQLKRLLPYIQILKLNIP